MGLAITWLAAAAATENWKIVHGKAKPGMKHLPAPVPEMGRDEEEEEELRDDNG